MLNCFENMTFENTYATMQLCIKRQEQVFLIWKQKLDRFLKFNKRVGPNKGGQDVKFSKK